jgi:selenocysteine lyase/cysteine desulfurase
MALAGLDYVALSGHKLYAPFGSGALIGRSDWLRAAPPYCPARRRHAQPDRRGRAGRGV